MSSDGLGGDSQPKPSDPKLGGPRRRGWGSAARVGSVGSRFLVLAMVVMMVTATAFTGTAVATHAKCSEVDEFFWVLSVGLMNDHCDADELSNKVTDLENRLANSTKVSIHETADKVDANEDQYLGVTNNYLLDSRTVAMSKAEAAIVKAIDDGDSLSQVKAEAKQAVEDYYTLKQMNLNDHFVTQVQSISTIEAAEESAGFSESFVSGGTKVSSDTYYDNHWLGFQNQSKDPMGSTTVTTVNGTTLSSKTLTATLKGSNYGAFYASATSKINDVNSDSNGNNKVRMDVVTIEPISGHPGGVRLNMSRYEATWNQIVAQNNQIENNAEVLAESIWNATHSDGMNLTSVVSASTLAQEYSTDYNSTGYFSYAVALAATSGFAIPDFNRTSLMTIQTASDTYTGLLMSQEPPDSGLFEVGQTYDASNLAGKQFVARTDGNVTELTAQFTITSMEDENGNPVQNTTVQQFNYTAVNSSANYSALQEQIRHLRDEILEEDPGTAPGGSTSSIPFGLSEAEGALGIVGIGAAGYLYMRGRSHTRAQTQRRRR